jgi:hypothetical protein
MGFGGTHGMAISGNQRPSEAISGPQRQSAHLLAQILSEVLKEDEEHVRVAPLVPPAE